MENSQTYNEQLLLLRVAKGEEAAFSILVDHYSDKLYKYVFRLTRRKELAEEVVQDIFVQLWQTRELLSDIRNLDAYLFIVSRNNGANALKKALRQKLRHQKWQETHTSPVIDDETEAVAYSLIDQAVENLPPQQKKVWIMSRHLRMKYSEIASSMGISIDSVNKYLQAARKNILQYLRQHAEPMLFMVLCYYFF